MSLPQPLKIVLTGGPGGGKTTFLEDLRRSDPNAERFILVPEAATLLIRAGHRPGSCAFQLAVVRLQQSLEEACRLPARTGQVLVCDRGTVDSLAYWLMLNASEEAFYSQTGIPAEKHFAEYHAALHFRTAAVGAEEHYLQIEHQAARAESHEEAARVDACLQRVWSRHPRLEVIENGNGGWPEKSRAAAVCLNRLLLDVSPSD